MGDEVFARLLQVEVQRHIAMLRSLQLGASGHHQQVPEHFAGPLHVIINNSSAVSMRQEISDAGAPAMVRFPEKSRWLRDLLASPANCAALFGGIYLSLYFAQGYADHRRRLAELQL